MNDLELEVKHAPLQLFMQALYHLGSPDAIVEQLDSDGDSLSDAVDEGDKGGRRGQSVRMQVVARRVTTPPSFSRQHLPHCLFGQN